MNDRPAHERHDQLLIAAHAAGDTNGADADRATRLLADCADCAALHDDLRILAAAVHDLAPATRRRDFTLSPDDAARVRRPSWRRLVSFLAGDRFRLARPVGAAFASLGVAGLLIASLPGVPVGGAGALPAAAPAERYEAAASAAEVSGVPGDAQVDDRVNTTGEDPSPLHLERQSAEDAGQRAQDTAGDPDVAGQAAVDEAVDTTLVVLSGSFVIVGLGLFGLRWTATRLGDA